MNELTEFLKVVERMGGWTLAIALAGYFMIFKYPAMRAEELKAKNERAESYNKNWQKVVDKIDLLIEKVGAKLLVESQLLIKLDENNKVMQNVYENCVEHGYSIREIKDKVLEVKEKFAENTKNIDHYPKVGVREGK